MNPPFGTRCKGIDMLFLMAGLRLARRAVYSMHKVGRKRVQRSKARRVPHTVQRLQYA